MCRHARRYERTLAALGFGLLGPEHIVEVMGKGGMRKGKSCLWLFPGAALRIFNLDESQVSGTDTQSSGAVVLAPEGIASGQEKPKKAQKHCTYVAVIRPPEYEREAKTVQGIRIPAVAKHDGAALPGMVRCCSSLLLW